MIAIRALPDLMRVALAELVAYRAEMVIWILTASMPLIMLALWNAVADGAPIAGYDAGGIARYFTANLIVRQLTSAWLVWQLTYEIRSGGLSARLLKPIHPLVHSAVSMGAALPFRAAVLLPLVLALVAWKPDLLDWQHPEGLWLVLPAIAVAFVMNVCIQALFGILGFWIDKSDSLFNAWFSVWMVLSGYVAPLATYPAWSQPWLRWSPFRGMLGLPVELLAGELTLVDAGPELLVQTGWMLGLMVAVRWAWARGIRRYGAFGA